MNIKVATVIDDQTLVLNVGENKGVKLGQRFLVYSLGDEIKDPDSEASLGRLEIVKGTGKATHVQQKMCTIKSEMKKESIQRIRRPNVTFSQGYGRLLNEFSGLSNEIEEYDPPTAVPFENPEVGDLVKMI